MIEQDVTAILQRLQESGLTQTEISQRTGIPQPRLSKWGAGNCPKSVNDALVLAKLDAEVSANKPVEGAHP